eukprot:gene24445-32603_t
MDLRLTPLVLVGSTFTTGNRLTEYGGLGGAMRTFFVDIRGNSVAGNGAVTVRGDAADVVVEGNRLDLALRPCVAVNTTTARRVYAHRNVCT